MGIASNSQVFLVPVQRTKLLFPGSAFLVLYSVNIGSEQGISLVWLDHRLHSYSKRIQTESKDWVSIFGNSDHSQEGASLYECRKLRFSANLGIWRFSGAVICIWKKSVIFGFEPTLVKSGLHIWIMIVTVLGKQSSAIDIEDGGVSNTKESS